MYDVDEYINVNYETLTEQSADSQENIDQTPKLSSD